MNKYFLVGQNIGYSLSPFIYNYLFKSHNIIARYVVVEKDIVSFPDFIRNFHLEGFVGGNITIPFKKTANLLVDKTVIPMESINFVVRQGNKTVGVNTDFLSMIELLSQRQYPTKNVLVFGNGGAANAVITALDCAFYNVDVIGRHDEVDYSKEYSILINATPVTMVGYDSSYLIRKADLSRLSSVKLIIDLVYNPVNTVLINEAKARNIEYIDGLEFLVTQALITFKIRIDATGSDDYVLSREEITELYNVVKKVATLHY